MKTRRATSDRPRSERTPRLFSDRGGAVYVEFLLAFIPLFWLFLGMVQMGFLYACDLVVRHAATTAARAAIVVLDDTPERYDGEVRRTLLGDGRAEPTPAHRFVQGVLGLGGLSAPTFDSARLADIHAAASLPLLPFAPNPTAIWRPSDENMRHAIGDIPEARAAFGVLYNETGLSVSFPTSPGEADHRLSWGPPDEEGVVPEDDGRAVTVRVTYLFHCSVPLANRLMCEDLLSMAYGNDVGRVSQLMAAFANGEINQAQLDEALADLAHSRERLTRWAPRVEELEGAGGESGIDLLYAMTALSSVFGGPRPRFVPIQREATLPLQAANYCYRGATDVSGCWDQETGELSGERDPFEIEPWEDPGGE